MRPCRHFILQASSVFRFTALGNLCLIHESIEHVVEVYDFQVRFIQNMQPYLQR